MKRASWAALTLSLLGLISADAVRASPIPSIPSANVLTLNFAGTTGILTLTPTSGTVFRIDASSGLAIPAPASVSNLALASSGLTLGFAAAFTGQVVVAIRVTGGSVFTVGGNFTPGTITAQWMGQMGGAKSFVTGARLAVE
jgi:hypothetical protein